MKIKARVWIKEHKMMLVPKAIHMDGTIETKPEDRKEHNGYDVCKWYSFPDECELMLCTGVKDKSGRDIYDGDIIQGYKDEQLIVRYRAPQFRIEGRFSRRNRAMCFSEGWHQLIVGNVYEQDEVTK